MQRSSAEEAVLVMGLKPLYPKPLVPTSSASHESAQKASNTNLPQPGNLKMVQVVLRKLYHAFKHHLRILFETQI